MSRACGVHRAPPPLLLLCSRLTYSLIDPVVRPACPFAALILTGQLEQLVGHDDIERMLIHPVGPLAEPPCLIPEGVSAAAMVQIATDL